MSKFDPPSDPFGSEKQCLICDQPLEYNWLTKEWECTHSHEKDESAITTEEWKRRYVAQLMKWGLSEIEAQEDCDAALIDLEVSPEDAADDEVSYMAQDS